MMILLVQFMLFGHVQPLRIIFGRIKSRNILG